MLKCIYDIKKGPYRVENIVIKEEIACYKQVLLCSQCFPQLCIFSASKYDNGLIAIRKVCSLKCRKPTDCGKSFESGQLSRMA